MNYYIGDLHLFNRNQTDEGRNYDGRPFATVEEMGPHFLYKESMTMEYRGLYVSATPDCEPNEGGYYCQVYADEDYGDQIDDFCIHPDELEENDDIKHWGKVNIDGSYRYYVENGVISPENSDI